MCVDGEVDAHLARLPGFDGLPVRGGTVSLHRLADQPDVEIEADARDVPGLLGAQHVSGAAQLEILQRHRHSRAELVVLRDRRQPVVGGLGQRPVGAVEQVGVSTLAAATDATAQLM